MRGEPYREFDTVPQELLVGLRRDTRLLNVWNLNVGPFKATINAGEPLQTVSELRCLADQIEGATKA